MARVVVDTTCPRNTQTLCGDQRIVINREAPKSTIVSRGAYCKRGAGKCSSDPAITRQIISPLAGSVIRFCLPGGGKKKRRGPSRFFHDGLLCVHWKKKYCTVFTIRDLVQPSVPSADTQMWCVITKKKWQLPWITVMGGSPNTFAVHSEAVMLPAQTSSCITKASLSQLHTISPHAELLLVKAFSANTNRRLEGYYSLVGNNLIIYKTVFVGGS